MATATDFYLQSEQRAFKTTRQSREYVNDRAIKYKYGLSGTLYMEVCTQREHLLGRSTYPKSSPPCGSMPREQRPPGNRMKKYICSIKTALVQCATRVFTTSDSVSTLDKMVRRISRSDV